jgi:hypothetical protein
MVPGMELKITIRRETRYFCREGVTRASDEKQLQQKLNERRQSRHYKHRLENRTILRVVVDHTEQMWRADLKLKWRDAKLLRGMSVPGGRYHDTI